MVVDIKYSYGDKVYFLVDNAPTAGLVHHAEILGTDEWQKVCYYVRYKDYLKHDIEARFNDDEIFDSLHSLLAALSVQKVVDYTDDIDLDD